MRKFTFFLALLAVTALNMRAQQFNYADISGKPGYNLVDAKAASVTVRYAIPSFSLDDQVVDGSTMKNISLNGTFLFNDEGMPSLPGSGRYIAIPQGATPRFNIISQRTEVIHQVEMAPSPRIPVDNDTRPMAYVKNSQVYSTNALYPASPVTMSEVTQIRGVDAVILGITPFQYNPVTKDLIVYKDLQVEVTFEGGNGQFGNPAFRSTWWDPILQDNLLNYASLPLIDYNARWQSAAKKPLTDECEYIIISPTGAAFLSWADSIRKFRTEQGILTKVFTVEQVGGNTVAAIEAFIDNAYNTWTIKPAACLMLGDYGTDGTKNLISHMYVHPDGYPNFASDNKYADVTGDEMPDVIFSRITANDATQLTTMVTKFLNYERNPPVNPRFYDKPITALGWQTVRWFQLCSEIVGGYFSAVQGKHPRRINKVYEGTPGSQWSTAQNTATIVNYFGPSGLSYIPLSPATLGGWDGGNASQVNQAIDSGAFMLQHRDHGYYPGWGEPSYEIGNIAQLTNSDLTFVFSINCQTGAYQRSTACFGEAFHRHTKNGHNSGALGLICPSETSYSFVNDVFVWGMYDNMWPDFMPAEGSTPTERGVLPAFGNAAGKYFLKRSNWPYNTNNKQITYRLFHMFGDAFQVMYSEIPTALTVVHDTAINFGATEFSIQANDSAFIALTLDGAVLATGYGIAGGPVLLAIPEIPVGSQVIVTVTKHNFYRYSHSVAVVSTTLQANFAASATSLCVGSSIDYNDLSSGSPISWAWVFAGGTPGTSTEQNPTGIAYSESGNHDVTLTVSKATGEPVFLTKTAYIGVSNLPVADFQAANGCPGVPLQLTDMTNPNGGILTSWSWNFGDPNSGSSNTSTEQNPTHAFTDPGTYIVTLEAKVNGLCTDTKVKEVVINSLPGVASKPTGSVTLCKELSGIVYTTEGATNATTYTWLPQPESAGTISGTGLTGTLALAPGFTGNFTIMVMGENECGKGIFSEALAVNVIEAPVAPLKPTGTDSVNLNKGLQSSFTIAEVPGALAYVWTLTPADAGAVSGTGLTGAVTWDKTFRGMATLQAKASNSCGEGLASEGKPVTIFAPVGISEIDGIGIDIFPNPNDGNFTLDLTSSVVNNVNITIMNALGVTVYTARDVKFQDKLHKNIHLTGLPQGIYHLKVNGNGVATSVKFVIGK
jgi:PKD repeat protein